MLTGSAHDLQRLIEDISEKTYCSGWDIGIETELWQCAVNGYAHGWLEDTVRAAEINELRRLTHACGGWVHWPGDADAPVFIRRDEWLKVYAGNTKTT